VPTAFIPAIMPGLMPTFKIEQQQQPCYTARRKPIMMPDLGEGMLDMEKARFNMIEQQIRPCEVLEGRILELLKHVRREHYVPKEMREMAFMDMEIPLGHGAYMWPPKLEARTLQELHLDKSDKVLEVGTGSGYLTALLSVLAGHVTSVEIVPELSAMAGQHLKAYHHDNTALEIGDAARGWGGGAKYDVIVLTGSTPVLPVAFQNSLNPGGRLFAIVGDAPVMEARLVTRVAADTFETVNIMETCVAPLQNALQPERFVF
jgi:protein-L-isoaspartate(D-aspartate) O-methyltransferase